MSARAAQNRAYYAKNRDRIRAKQAAWRKRNRAYLRGRALERKFGLTAVQYEELLKAQGGGCAICGRSTSSDGKRLAVDHNHSTHKVRGLLCDLCNRALGLFGDDVTVVQSALFYLEEDE